MRLILKMLPPRISSPGDPQLFPNLLPLPITPFPHHILLRMARTLPFGLVANPKLVPRRQRRTKQVRLVGVSIAIDCRIESPFDEAESGVEAHGQTVAEGFVEVVSEDEVVAAYVFFGGEGEGNGVLVFGVEVVFEIVACCGGILRETWVVRSVFWLSWGVWLGGLEPVPS